MSTAPRVLAVFFSLAALAYAADSVPPPTAAQVLAARLMAASDAHRQEMLGQAEFASVEVARALLDSGRQIFYGAEFKRALGMFRTAQAVAEHVGGEKERAQAMGGAAACLTKLGDLEASLREQLETIPILERVGDVSALAEGWNAVGAAYWPLGRMTEADKAYRKALELWETAGNRRGVARANNNVGIVAAQRADFDEALGHYERARQILEEVSEQSGDRTDRMMAALVVNNIAEVHLSRGEYRLARDYAERSLAGLEAIGERYGAARCLELLGNISRAQGAYARALNLLHRSLKLREEIGEKWGVLQTWNSIGAVHFAQGEYVLAIDAYKRTLRLNAEMGGDVQVAETLGNVAAAAWRLGDGRRAEANYRESIRIARREGYKDLEAKCLQGLGRIALDEGRYAEAGALLRRAHDMREALKDQAGVAETLDALASLELARQRPADALTLARRAEGLAGPAGQSEAEWEADTLAGIALGRLGHLDEACRWLDKAVANIETLRLQVAGGEQTGTRFLEARLSPYHELMALALRRGSPVEALELAERSKARALADLVHRGHVDLAGAMGPEDRREEERLRAAVVTLNVKIQSERKKDAPDTGRLASLESERRTRRVAYEAFEAAVEARHPELNVQRGHATPFTFVEAEPLLADHSVAIVEYVVTETDAYLFVLTREAGRARLDSYPVGLGRAAMARRARRLRERIAGRDLAFAEDARNLYDLLLAPAAARLKGRTHIIVVPDGPLWEVPFQALRDPAGRYLIESAAVSYAPSLTVLRETLQRRKGSAAPSVLAMGKADFGARGAPPAVALMSDLGPLPDAERQVRMIAGLYGPERSTAYLGPEAREDRFKQEAPRHAILHLATHGMLDETSPLYSHVVLSPGSGGSSEDGLLEAWEMMGLKLDADLVILSACETGRGQIAPGEGIVGTMWALFVAGSRALLASQWKVESGSTTELMTAFHGGLLRGDGSKAAQLQRASLALLRQPRYAHPFYWAGFVLVGNPY